MSNSEPPRFTLAQGSAGDYEPQITEDELTADEQVLLEPEAPHKRWLALASLACGILSLCAWVVPYIGIPVSVIGIVAGFLALKSERRKISAAGLVLCSVTFLLALMNALVGIYGLLWNTQ